MHQDPTRSSDLHAVSSRPNSEVRTTCQPIPPTATSPSPPFLCLQYTPPTHKIVSVVALMDSQEEAAPLLQVRYLHVRWRQRKNKLLAAASGRLGT